MNSCEFMDHAPPLDPKFPEIGASGRLGAQGGVLVRAASGGQDYLLKDVFAQVDVNRDRLRDLLRLLASRSARRFQ